MEQKELSQWYSLKEYLKKFISRIESEFENKTDKKPEKIKEVPPENFTCATDFEKEYKFISNDALLSFIREFPEFWDNNIILYKRRFYFDPKKFIEFILFPPDSFNSGRRIVKNKFDKWKEFIPQLKKWEKEILIEKGLFR